MSVDGSRDHFASADRVDAEELTHFGYRQVLRRTMGLGRSTMVNISTSSVTTAMFTLFAFGLLTGGTAFIWTYAVGFAILLLVTICFSELGSNMPIAGALYPWASRLVGPRYGYAVGWLYVAAQTAICAAVAYGIAPFVASLFNWSITANEQATVAVVIIVLSTMVNLVGISVASGISAVGAVAEVVGMLVIVAVLIVTGIGNQPVEVLFKSEGLAPGGGFLSVALATMLFGSWAYTGLEMTTDMAEETHEAPRVIPRAAITSICTTFGVGMIFLIVSVLAIPSIGGVFESENPLQAIIEGNTSSGFYDATLVVVIVAVFVATVTNQALTARALFALARDRKFPASGTVETVPKSTRVPAVAIVIVGILASALLLFTNAIGVIAVACLTALFACYMLVVWGQLYARLRGDWEPTHWTVGRMSLPINVLAAVLGTALTINIAWPRGEAIWYERWSGWVFTGGVLLCALIYYLVGGRKARAAIDAHPAALGIAPHHHPELATSPAMAAAPESPTTPESVE
ncbi:MAG: APC family permease [Solirubrobacterales bacterium]